MPNPVLDYLLSRRSVSVKKLEEPGPSEPELLQILRVASRVPDHKKMAPWRFHVFDKAAQAKLGDRWAELYAERERGNPDVMEKHIEFERERPQRAPLLIAVVSKTAFGKAPIWEQQLSAGAACMNLMHAAHALGYAANWLSEWPNFDDTVRADFGCEKPEDQIAGFIYIGTPSEAPSERDRPDLKDVVIRH